MSNYLFRKELWMQIHTGVAWFTLNIHKRYNSLFRYPLSEEMNQHNRLLPKVLLLNRISQYTLLDPRVNCYSFMQN